MIKSVLMLWITGLKDMMMPFKILQGKEINLQQLPMMSEITLLTIVTVIIVLLNGKIIVHKMIHKYIYIYINIKGTLMLLNVHVHVGQPTADPKVVQKTFSFCKITQLAIQLLATGQQADISIKVKIFHLWLSIFFKIINILYQRRVKVNIQNNPTLYYICKLY